MLERLKMGGEGDDRGWDGWMASRTQWTWIWVNSGSWWWTGRPGMVQSMGRKGSDTTEWLNWTDNILFIDINKYLLSTNCVLSSPVRACLLRGRDSQQNSISRQTQGLETYLCVTNEAAGLKESGFICWHGRDGQGGHPEELRWSWDLVGKWVKHMKALGPYRCWCGLWIVSALVSFPWIFCQWCDLILQNNILFCGEWIVERRY